MVTPRLLLLAAVLAAACASVACGVQRKNRVPAAVKTQISTFAENSACSDSRVDKYDFAGETVYVFEPGTCGADMQSNVVDTKGKSLGTLGGFTGNRKINGRDFDEAKFAGTVWKKDSKVK